MADETNMEIESERMERDVEALLFASDAPLSAAKLASLTGAPSVRPALAAIAALTARYRESRRSFAIVELAGGYQIATLPEFAPLVAQLFKGKKRSRLTQPALETLAIIAYKQPISRMQIEAIRGVNCEGVLVTLIERDLVTISGRAEALGKPFLYSTTKTFLEYMGLKDFRDLPSVEDLEKRFSLEEIVERPLVPPPAAESDAAAGGAEA